MRIVMMGTGTFAEPTFQALIQAGKNVVGLITQPDRDSGVKRGSTRQTGLGMATIAEQAGIPVRQPVSINSPEGLAALQELNPDLLVVAAYGQILSKAVIATPPMGAINVHASLLPKYRGASPIAHAIRSGETQTGVTIIRITLGLDAGEMLAWSDPPVDIFPQETTGQLELRLADEGAQLCLGVLNRMEQGPVSGTKQDPTKVTKAPKFTKDDGQIDWSRPAKAIVNHVRAMQPWPTAYTYFHRPGREPMRVIVSRAIDLGRPLPADQMPTFGAIEPLSDRISVTAGGLHLDGSAVEILEIQPAGKKKMSAVEFLRGYPIQAGFHFGPESRS